MRIVINQNICKNVRKLKNKIYLIFTKITNKKLDIKRFKN